jgi:hypothetical protein
MEDKTAIKRVDRPDHPNRCQHVSDKGQCNNVAVEIRKSDGDNGESGTIIHGQFCLVHGGNKAVENYDKQNLKNYRITKYRVRLAEMRSSEYIKDLRDEVAILRMILEEKMNGITSNTDLILQSGSISEMVIKIERLVLSCQKLEDKLGVTMDKAKVILIAEQMIGIISKHEKDANVVENIANDISKLLGENIG